jgi:hypothetical protein
MKAKITPTQDIEQLKENLEKRVEEVEIDGDKIEAEVEEKDVLERVPGIESFEVGEETGKGLKGEPVDELAYARLESREDTVRAFLATVQGWNLVVLETDRKWDLRNLRKYNPDIKKVKSSEPVEELEVEKSISDIEGTEKVEIEMPEEDETELIYREMLT